MKILNASQDRQSAEIVRTLSDSFDAAKDEAVTQSPVEDDELLDGYHRLPVSEGVLVVGVEPASPAVRAGLREGDIIIAFKNQPVASIDQLQRCLGATEIGVTSPITVVRHTQKIELSVTPEEWQPIVRRN